MKISVLVAAFNVENYIEECLNSLCCQDLLDCEFIVIDDGSNDSTGLICDSFALKDTRIKVVHQLNKGLLCARKVAVSLSSGEYVLFLDGDDFLEYPSALSDIYEHAQLNRADILRFDVIAVLPDGTLDVQRMNLFGKKGSNQIGSFNIIKQCFLDNLHCWNLWQFLYSGSVARKAYSHAVDERFIIAEDAYVFFLLAFFSNTFKCIDTKPIYHYRVASGITTSNFMSFESYKEHAKQSLCISWLKEFLEQMGDLQKYDLILDNLKFRLMNWEFDALKNLDAKYRSDAFGYLATLPDVESRLAFMFSYSTRNSVQSSGLKEKQGFSKYKYLKYKIISKITLGQTRKKYREKYLLQKKLKNN